ncbi:MAG: glycosyltransferase family 4 protein [Jaaginema sp. PMC 1079.18]|nr:glycosyltransferase family 4 protein [Jaaginema sp. PMC 1079.18]
MSNGFVFAFLEVFECEGGIQTYNQNLLAAYTALDDQPAADVLVLRDRHRSDNPLASSRLRFHSFYHPSRAVGRIAFVLHLFNFILWQRPRHVFCGHLNLAPLIHWLCQPFNIPYTVIAHGKEVWFPVSRREQQALSQAKAIWTVSHYSSERASQANHLDPQLFRWLPCTIDGDRFSPGIKPPHLLVKYNLTNAKVLMTVARLWSGDIYKGVDVTLRALPEIARHFPEVKYLVIGRGDDRPRLEQLAIDLGVRDRVVFAGFVPTAELVAHYRVADAYVMPSQEGFGIVYLEAMACGLPVVSGDDDGSADPLLNGKLGWRVPHRSPEAVARACVEILKGQDARCQGDWLREQCLYHFGRATFTKRLRKFLNDS